MKKRGSAKHREIEDRLPVSRPTFPLPPVPQPKSWEWDCKQRSPIKGSKGEHPGDPVLPGKHANVVAANAIL